MNYQEICKKYKLESLRGADLRGANLLGADLSYADLRGADLRGADLLDAELRGADLSGADLSGADLSGADLSGAELRGADLSGAELRGADMSGAGLVVIYGEQYFITICKDVVRAGCQQHTVEEWRSFTKRDIAGMEGRIALKYYPRLLDLIDFYCGKGERPAWVNESK